MTQNCLVTNTTVCLANIFVFSRTTQFIHEVSKCCQNFFIFGCSTPLNAPKKQLKIQKDIVFFCYLQRDVVSTRETLTHGGERHLLNVPDALVDAVDGLVTFSLPGGLIPMTTQRERLLQGCPRYFSAGT